MPAGGARIRVSFQVDADGLLAVSAREQTTGVEAHITVKPSYGLSDDEISTMLRAGFEHANTDMQLRALRENIVEAERLIEATQQALSDDAHLLDGTERRRIEAAITHLAALIAGTDANAVKSGTDALSAATGDFAARRMDHAIRQALTGSRVDNLPV